MARTLNDLTYFTKAIIGMQPWKYDYTVHPISWRKELEDEAKSKSLRIGLMSADGMFTNFYNPPTSQIKPTNMVQASFLPRPPSSAPSPPPSPP
jgi:hypothetical protein